MQNSNKAFSAVNMLIQTNRLHKRLIDTKVAGRIGLHRTQHIILMRLAKTGVLPSQKELADHLGVSAAAITTALKKLESGGYIERSCGNDNRYNEIRITALGKTTVEDSKSIFLEIDKSMFINFSYGEIDELIASLEKIQNNILSQMEENVSV